MKYKVTAHLDFDKDIVDLDDNLSAEEVEEELYEYVCNFFSWSYRNLDDEEDIDEI